MAGDDHLLMYRNSVRKGSGAISVRQRTNCHEFLANPIARLSTFIAPARDDFGMRRARSPRRNHERTNQNPLDERKYATGLDSPSNSPSSRTRTSQRGTWAESR